jgi:excisionase family DNA binding protein
MLTPREIAALTGLSYRSVLRAIEDGELRAFRLRGRLRVEHEAYAAWLEANQVSARTPANDYTLMAGRLRAQPKAGSLRALHESTLTE